MAVWLGQAGGLRLSRSATGRFFTHIAPADVDVSSNRFGFDSPVTALITGDLVWIRRVDGAGQPIANDLDFVDPSGWSDGQRHSDGQWFVNVDAVGGVRLFKEWADALSNERSQAVRLTVPSSSYRLSMQIKDGSADCLAQTVSWELNTNRDVADISALGDGFQRNMGTLVSGSGQIDCLFDYKYRQCARGYDSMAEMPVYLHQLVMRQEIGSSFTGIFLLKQSGSVPLDEMLDELGASRELFYQCQCVITGVAVALNPTETIRSQIQFVTTGEIQLLYDYPSSYLLQEQVPNDKVLQESDFGILLEVPS